MAIDLGHEVDLKPIWSTKKSLQRYEEDEDFVREHKRHEQVDRVWSGIFPFTGRLGFRLEFLGDYDE